MVVWPKRSGRGDLGPVRGSLVEYKKVAAEATAKANAAELVAEGGEFFGIDAVRVLADESF